MRWIGPTRSLLADCQNDGESCSLRWRDGFDALAAGSHLCTLPYGILTAPRSKAVQLI
jgi:hypothetical protein